MSLTTRVHEYGGGAFIVHNGVIYFVDHSGQQIHMLSEPLKDPTPLTKGKGMRYADCDFHSSANKLICVREDHSVVESGASKEAQNTIVVFDIASKTENVLVCCKQIGFLRCQHYFLLFLIWNLMLIGVLHQKKYSIQA